jgi:hypothetical protein
MTADPHHMAGEGSGSRRPHATTPEAEQAHAAWEELVRVECTKAAAAEPEFEITGEIDAALRKLLSMEAAAAEARPRRKGGQHPFWAEKVLRLVEAREERKGRQEKPRTAAFCARVLDPLLPVPPDKTWLQENMADFFEALVRGDVAAVSPAQPRAARRLRDTVLPFAEYLVARFGNRHIGAEPLPTDPHASTLQDVVDGLAPDKSPAEWAFALGRLDEAIGQEMRQYPRDTMDRDARRRAMLNLIRGLPKSRAYWHQSAANRTRLDRQLEQLESQVKRAWHRLHLEPPSHAERDRRRRAKQ